MATIDLIIYKTRYAMRDQVVRRSGCWEFTGTLTKTVRCLIFLELKVRDSSN